MKSPVMAVERAAAVYQGETCAFSFREDLEFYLLNGFVFSRPDYFVMGRPVISKAPQSDVVGRHLFQWDKCDCWHVYLASGNLMRAWDILPWELPLMSFERKNVLNVYPLDSIRRLSGARPNLP